MRNISTSNLDRPRVLLVEDEAAFGAMLRYNLETHGFLVDHVRSGQEALSRGAQFRPHVVLLDWTLPGMCGIEVCRRLRSQPETKDVGVIMVTGRAGDKNAVRGLDAGATITWSSRSARATLMQEKPRRSTRCRSPVYRTRIGGGRSLMTIQPCSPRCHSLETR